MAKKNQDLLTPLCQLATYVFLIGAVLFLVYAGSHLFRNVTDQKNQNEHLRSTAFYLQNQLAANDSAGVVSVGEGPEGDDMLVIAIPEKPYYIYVYTYQGYLMEELGTAGGVHPAQAEKITPVSSLEIEQQTDQRLQVKVDGLSVWLTLRSGGGEANG
jgi:flagellar biogenesis protein FliO